MLGTRCPLWMCRQNAKNYTAGPLCNEEGSDETTVIIIPVLLSLSTLVVVVLIFCSLVRRRRTEQHTTSPAPAHANGQEFLPMSTAPRIPSGLRDALRPWEIPTECTLEGIEFWQDGRYGPICNGSLKQEGSSTAVVVKTLKEGPNQPRPEEFVEWALFHAAVCRHENLVRMLCCQTQRLPMYFVLEACSPGNLLHFLWALRQRQEDSVGGDALQHFSERSVFLVAKQVAAGLDYLWSVHRLVHSDVAARNVLIGPGLTARLAGLAVAFAGRRTESSAARRRVADVPLKWQAPERLMRQPTTDRSDVWSFGILLYELITLGSPPFPDLEPLSVLTELQRSYRMKRPVDCGVPLYDLMKYCWMLNFKDRPTFSATIKLLKSYTYLAGTKALRSAEPIDVFEYSKKAGVVPLG